MKQPHKQLAARTKKDHNVIYIVALGIAIIAIAAISSHFIPQSKKAQEKLKEIQIMQKIVQIDDIGHEQDKILHNIGSGYNMKRDRMYHVADNAYHTKQYNDEKFTAAESLNDLIKEQNIFIHDLIVENPFSKIQKEKFDQIQKDIDELQKK